MKASISLGLLVGAALSIGAARNAEAQRAVPSAVVRVFVVDSSGAAVTRAELAVLRGLKEVIAHGTTDDYGRASIAFAAGSGEYDIVVRKLGYPRSDRVFQADANDTIALSIVVPSPIAKQLDVVKDARHHLGPAVGEERGASPGPAEGGGEGPDLAIPCAAAPSTPPLITGILWGCCGFTCCSFCG